jgi:hypothetical protein
MGWMSRAHMSNHGDLTWRPLRHLGRTHHTLTNQINFFGGQKCHFKGLDIMLEGVLSGDEKIWHVLEEGWPFP